MKNHWPPLGSLGDVLTGVTPTDATCVGCGGCWAWAHAAGTDRPTPATRAGMANQRITWERMCCSFRLLVEGHHERAGVDTVGGPVRDRQRDGAVAVVVAGVGVAADLP